MWVEHRYPDRHIVLDVWSVKSYSGEPHGREGQSVAWRDVRSLDSADFPPADAPVLAALRLPRRYLVTPEPGRDWNAFLDRLADRVSRGFDLIQLRAKSLGEPVLVELGRRAAEICRGGGAKLLMNTEPEIRAALRRRWCPSDQPALGPYASRAICCERRTPRGVPEHVGRTARRGVGCHLRSAGRTALPDWRVVPRRRRSRTGTDRGLRFRGTGAGTGDPDPSRCPGAPMERLHTIGTGRRNAGIRDRGSGRRRPRRSSSKRRAGRRCHSGVLG